MKNEIINYESIIKWENGEPIVVYREMLTKEVLADLPLAALSLPYKRTDEEILLGLDPGFEGKSNAEVMNIRLTRLAAQGHLDSIKMLQDRILGRPKQSIETKSITMSYAEYLEKKAEEANETIEAEVNQL